MSALSLLLVREHEHMTMTRQTAGAGALPTDRPLDTEHGQEVLQ